MKLETSIIFAALLLSLTAQWLLFESSVRELVLPGYPRHHDQTRYLIEAFIDDAAIRSDGVAVAFARRVSTGNPTGSLLDFEAALAFRLVEPNRLGALAAIFAHFAALQLAFFHVATWATGSALFGGVAVALLVSSGFLFVVPGGWFDFRIDAAASCAFGIFVAALVRSDVYRRRSWSVVTGIAAGYLIALRHNMIVHLAALHVVFLVSILIDDGTIRSGGRRIAGFLSSVAAMIAVAGPFLLFSYPQIAEYYTSQFAARGPIRGTLSGRSLFQHWAFYPYNVFVHHLRFMPLIAALALSLPWAMRRLERDVPAPAVEPSSRYWPLLVSIALPLLILTAHSGRSTTVAGLVLPPIALLTTFALADLASRWPPPATTAPAVARGRMPLALAVALLGCAVAVHALQHQIWRRSERARLGDGVAVFEMHYEIARAAVERGLRTPAYVVNSLEDEIDPGIGSTALFERQRRLLIPSIPIVREQIFTVGEDEFWRNVRGCDIALLQTAGERLRYPFVEFAMSVEGDLFAEINRRFDKIGDWSFSDSAASAYIAPRPGGR